MCSELAFQYPGVILPVNFNIYGILIFHWFPSVITILQVKSKVHTPGKNERNTSRWIITTVGIHHHRCKTVEMIIIAKLYKRSPAWDNPYISCKTHSRRESSPVPISIPIQDLNCWDLVWKRTFFHRRKHLLKLLTIREHLLFNILVHQMLIKMKLFPLKPGRFKGNHRWKRVHLKQAPEAGGWRGLQGRQGWQGKLF